MLNKKGFTLIEVLVTILIVSASVVAIAAAFNTGVYVTADIENTDKAIRIAEAKMEEIEALVAESGVSALADSGPTADADFPNYNVTVNVTENLDPMPVEVTVSWVFRGDTLSFTLQALVADY